jgi:hypothetical protein
MINALKIIDEVNRLIVEKYPDCTVYINNMPEGFERPSFFIDLIFDSSSSNNRALTDERVSLQLVYFSPVNGHFLSDATSKLAVHSELKNMFQAGFIKVDDRAIKITSYQSVPRDNEVYGTLDLEYVDDRAGYIDLDVQYNTDVTDESKVSVPGYPDIKYMKNVIIKQGVDK